VFCFRYEYTLALMSRAALQGLRTARDFYLLSREEHAGFSFLFPEVSRYTIRTELLIKQVLQLTKQMQSGAPPKAGPYFVMPDFIEGETLPPIG